MMKFESSPEHNRWSDILPKIEHRPSENLTQEELEHRSEIIKQLIERIAPWWEQKMAQDIDPNQGTSVRSVKQQLADFVAYIGAQKDLLDQLVLDAKKQEKYLERPMIKLVDGNETFPSVALEGWGENWGKIPLLKTPDVWSLGWRQKGEELEGTEIHDHFDSEAGVYVYNGRVLETVYAFSKSDWSEKPERLEARETVRELKEGQAIPIRAPYVHLIQAHPEEPASFTIHGYFPELKGMHMYEYKDGALVLTDTWNADDEAEGEKQSK